MSPDFNTEDDIIELTDIVEQGTPPAPSAADDDLFGGDGGDADFEKELEDLFADSDDAGDAAIPDASGDIDFESDLDDLLGSLDDSAPAAETATSDADSGGIDFESELDDLLGDLDDSAPSSAPADLNDDVDNLLAGLDEPDTPTASSEDPDDLLNDIDDLLGGIDVPSVADTPEQGKSPAEASGQDLDFSELDALLDDMDVPSKAGDDAPTDDGLPDLSDLNSLLEESAAGDAILGDTAQSSDDDMDDLLAELGVSPDATAPASPVEDELDINALLDSPSEPAAPEAADSDVDDLLAELGVDPAAAQSPAADDEIDIDALLDGAADIPAPSPTEVADSDVDDLLADLGLDPAPDAAPEAEPEDKLDIDALLDATPDTSADSANSDAGSGADSDIDDLLADLGLDADLESTDATATEAPSDTDELDIDALLNGDDDITADSTPVQDSNLDSDVDDLLADLGLDDQIETAPNADDEDALDLDALLDGTEQIEPVEAVENSEDISNIDAMLQPEAPAAATPQEAAAEDSLDDILGDDDDLSALLDSFDAEGTPVEDTSSTFESTNDDEDVLDLDAILSEAESSPAEPSAAEEIAPAGQQIQELEDSLDLGGPTEVDDLLASLETEEIPEATETEPEAISEDISFDAITTEEDPVFAAEQPLESEPDDISMPETSSDETAMPASDSQDISIAGTSEPDTSNPDIDEYFIEEALPSNAEVDVTLSDLGLENDLDMIVADIDATTSLEQALDEATECVMNNDGSNEDLLARIAVLEDRLSRSIDEATVEDIVSRKLAEQGAVDEAEGHCPVDEEKATELVTQAVNNALENALHEDSPLMEKVRLVVHGITGAIIDERLGENMPDSVRETIDKAAAKAAANVIREELLTMLSADSADE